MTTITWSEFTSHKNSYLNRIKHGEDILIDDDNVSFKIVINEDDTQMTKEEFETKVRNAETQYEKGECKSFNNASELEEYLDSL